MGNLMRCMMSVAVVAVMAPAVVQAGAFESLVAKTNANQAEQQMLQRRDQALSLAGDFNRDSAGADEAIERARQRGVAQATIDAAVAAHIATSATFSVVRIDRHALLVPVDEVGIALLAGEEAMADEDWNEAVAIFNAAKADCETIDDAYSDIVDRSCACVSDMQRIAFDLDMIP